ARTIISIEKEQYSPSLMLAYRLARAFGTTVEDLCCLHENLAEEDKRYETLRCIRSAQTIYRYNPLAHPSALGPAGRDARLYGCGGRAWRRGFPQNDRAGRRHLSSALFRRACLCRRAHPSQQKAAAGLRPAGRTTA